jgi:hypothetical protein
MTARSQRQRNILLQTCLRRCQSAWVCSRTLLGPTNWCVRVADERARFAHAVRLSLDSFLVGREVPTLNSSEPMRAA